jgi:hypothetical protein
MEAKLNFYEYRDEGGADVRLTTNIDTPQELENWIRSIRGLKKAPPDQDHQAMVAGGHGIVAPPTEPAGPFFDIGDATGKKGDEVLVSVYGGSVLPMSGFHIGGGCGLNPNVERSGYSNLRAKGVHLGSYLTDYLTSHDALSSAFQRFEMIEWGEVNHPLPEEWWQYALGFFTLSGGQIIPPIPIPQGTELFQVSFEILTDKPGELGLTCINNHYYTQKKRRRRAWCYTGEGQGQHRVDCNGGKLVVTG